ncbi:hypothetical protein LP420_25565 [Massilia sp. B-10]|nr:hypothetical protein LP420_25565 [Massilia sp. B-10]
MAEDLKLSLRGLLTGDAAANVALVRAHARLGRRLDPGHRRRDAEKTLLGMAIDADIVLDLHCDNEAVLHIYALAPRWRTRSRRCRPTWARTRCCWPWPMEEPFDEACSRLWWDLAEHFGPAFPLPPSCVSVTVELRGEMDVGYDYARKDRAP